MSLRVILVRSKHSGNVGSAARAMKNFGLGELCLLQPRCRIDRQAFAMASHAADVLEGASVVDTASEALAGCSYVLGTTARMRASPAFEVLAPQQGVARLPEEGGAIMFGPEDTGLSNEELDLCQAAVRIPTAEYASLNLAQAVNVMAYEWFVRRGLEGATGVQGEYVGATEANSSGEESTGQSGVHRPAAHRAWADYAPAGREGVEAMIGHLMETLLYIGYTDETKAPSVEHMYRRIFDRALLTEREVAALRGLWTQMKWAADQPPERVPGRRGSR